MPAGPIAKGRRVSGSQAHARSGPCWATRLTDSTVTWQLGIAPPSAVMMGPYAFDCVRVDGRWHVQPGIPGLI
jgi:hypothetical protein